MIYFDNAATSLHKPPEVAEAMINAMKTCGNPGRGAHAPALQAERILFHAREQLAALFGCSAAERVIFTSNATEALNIAIFGLIAPGDHVISTDLEHNSILRPLYHLEKTRHVSVDFLPADKFGTVSLEHLETLLRPNTKAVICTHASNVTGNVLDLERISAFTKRHGLLLIADVTQTAGAFPIDMEKTGIDVVCFTGHKGLLGPQGTGGLCMAPHVEIAPWKMGGTGIHSYDKGQPAAYPTRLEAGTPNVPGIGGLSAALDFISKIGTENILKQEQLLTKYFYEQVVRIPSVRVYGDFSTWHRAPIVLLNSQQMDSSLLADLLFTQYEIAVRSGAHCAPRMHRALGTDRTGAVRFSFSLFNTKTEIDTALTALKELLS